MNSLDSRWTQTGLLSFSYTTLCDSLAAMDETKVYSSIRSNFSFSIKLA